MNNFNLVLAAIQKQCAQVNVPYKDCVDKVRSELDAEYREHLDLYLSFLQDLGLIVYNNEAKEIMLTDLGKIMPPLFS